MDSIVDFLDEIEDILDACKPLPFSSKVSVDREKIMSILSEIRLYLPDEIMRSQRIVDDHDRVISDAKQKAGHIIRDAEIKAEALISDHEIYKAAEADANELMTQTKKTAKEIRLSTMNYADEMIAKTETMMYDIRDEVDKHMTVFKAQIDKTLGEIRDNRNSLRNNKQ